MNNIFAINGNMHGENPHIRDIEIKFTKNDCLEATHIQLLIENLTLNKNFWIEHQEYITGAVVQVNYYGLIPKSKRIDILFTDFSLRKNIVGAKYSNFENSLNLSMVYFSETLNDFDGLIGILEDVKNYVIDEFDQKIDKKNFDEKYSNLRTLFNLNKKDFAKLLLEISRIQSFSVPNEEIKSDNEQIVRFYVNPFNLKKPLDIHLLKSSLLENTVVLDKKDIEYLKKNAPYFISQSFDKKFENPKDEPDKDAEIDDIPLERPSNEEIIGVIDAGYNEKSYLGNWVEAVDLRNNKDDSCESLSHGTKICSILVHGGDINESLGLNDNCGHFRVKHFAVLDENNDVIEIATKIEKIIEENHKKILVWNISIGTNSEIPNDFISPLASKLDELQAKYNVIFVVCATNKPKDFVVDDDYRIGSPADSINSLVVGSVKLREQRRASYSRKGGVLGFFVKPDVSYYGGDIERKIYAHNGFQFVECCGTSFAAPFIARKLAFLIYKAGLTREEAKALLIHSASEWKEKYDDIEHIGRGIVYADIKDILSTPDDEIKFIVSDKTKAYFTSDSSFPIPLNDQGKCPFAVVATMCYFTDCSLNCGVDYTNTEVDLKFGPFKDGLKSIRDDGQYEDGRYVNEKQARQELSKWDNVKHFCSKMPSRNSGFSIQGATKWGFKLITSYRNKKIATDQKYCFNFAIVVTLKSADNINRVSQFRRGVESSNTWNIRAIDVDSLIKVNIALKEKIKLV